MLQKRTACFLVNAFDWFDQAMILILVPVFARLFFPENLRHMSVFLFYVIIALTYLARPVGALLFGHLADKRGVRGAIFCSLLISGVCFFLIGCLPVSQSHLLAIGICLIVLRVIHVVAIGGLFAMTNTFLYEASTKRRTFNASFVFSGLGFGVLLALLLNLLLGHTLSFDEFYSWGWRLPYWSGVLPILLAFWFRFGFADSSSANPSLAVVACPLFDVLKNNTRHLIVLFFQSAFLIIALYQVMILLPVHLRIHFGFDFEQTVLFALLPPILFLLLTPFMANFSEKYDGLRLCRIALVAMLLFAYPLYNIFRQVEWITALASIVVLTVILSLFAGSLSGLYGRYFLPAHRSTATGLVFSLATVLLGGSAPLISIFLSAVYWPNVGPAIYMMVAAAVALAFSLLLRK